MEENRFLYPLCKNNKDNKGCKIYPETSLFLKECFSFRSKDPEMKSGKKVPLSKINKFLGYN